MQFHLHFNIPELLNKISIDQEILLMGTCFAENIGSALKENKFRVFANPHGILYNPLSISKALETYLEKKLYSSGELFFQNGVWNSWGHHSRFSHPGKEKCLELINSSQEKAAETIRSAGWLMITNGTAFVYNLKEEGSVVGNCHKAPAATFEKKLLSVQEGVEAYSEVFKKLFSMNPNIQVLLTVSPVRYIRDGVVENNLSKSILIQTTHQLTARFKNVHYFPAYELIMDDLRDYRFFNEDLVHPTRQAVNYVWERFEETCLDEKTKEFLRQFAQIQKAKLHRPRNPGSEEYKKFLQDYYQKTADLARKHPILDFSEELEYFGK